jgi:arginine kinase
MNTELFPDNSHSLIKKHLSKTIYERLKKKKTSSGYTIDQAIKSGILNPDSEIGIYAGDAETYNTFSEILDLIIADYHAYQPHNWHVSDISIPSLPILDIRNKYIVSTRIRVARNLDGFPFTTSISANERRQVEQLIVKAVKNLPKNLQGQYYHLKDILSSNSKSLNNSFFPEKGDRFQEAAGITRDFPESRGFFIANNQKFMIWVNEEDHLRIISMEPGSDIAGIFNRLADAIKILEQDLKFSFSEQYGYLTACPSNIGISMRASVHIKLPKLCKKKELLYKTAEEYRLQIRGTSGEKSSVEDSILDISNKQRLGISEKDCLLILSKGVQKLIELEEQI